MNITTATIYAKNGYKIFRLAWKDKTGMPIRFIHVIKEANGDLSFMSGDSYYIMQPEDTMTEDWRIVQNDGSR